MIPRILPTGQCVRESRTIVCASSAPPIGTDIREMGRLLCASTLLLLSGTAVAKNLALGSPYTFSPLAQYEYTDDGQENVQLTDGEHTKWHFWTSKTSVGWVSAGTIQIEIDLQNRAEIEEVCVNTARGNNAEVSFAERVDVFVSEDKQSYAYAGDLLSGHDHSDGAYLVRKFCASLNNSGGRYVWLLIQPKGKFTFLDEIEVYGRTHTSSPPGAYPLRRDGVLALHESHVFDAQEARALQFEAARLQAMLNKVVDRSAESARAKAQVRDIISRLGDEKRNAASLSESEAGLFRAHHTALRARFINEPLLIWNNSNPWGTFTRFDSPTEGQLIRGPISLDLIGQGVTSAAFCLTNNSAGIQRLKISVASHGSNASKLPKVIVREAVRIVTSSGTVVADPLVPIDSREIQLVPGESRQIWLTAFAGDAGAGAYTANVTVEQAKEAGTTRIIPLNIKVWTVHMPKKPTVMSVNWSYLNSRSIAKMPKQAAADLRSHHTNVIVLHPSELPWPRFKDETSEKFTLDYRELDRVISLHSDADKFLLYMQFNNRRIRTFGNRYAFARDDWKRVFTDWVSQVAQHMQQKGISYERLAFYPVDEPRNDEESNCLIETASVIKRVNSELQIYTTLGGLANRDLLTAMTVVDTFQVLVQELNGPRVGILKEAKEQVWTYTAIGGGKSGDPLGFYRLQAWRAFRADAMGVGFWAYADSGPSGTSWNDMDGIRPDFSVIYEGDQAIISSKRWEAWREGIEDYELLVQAQRNVSGRPEEREFLRLVDSVIGNPDDYKMWTSVRGWLLEAASP